MTSLTIPTLPTLTAIRAAIRDARRSFRAEYQYVRVYADGRVLADDCGDRQPGWYETADLGRSYRAARATGTERERAEEIREALALGARYAF